MKTKDILTITTVAVGTAALTVVTFWSNPLNAGLDPEGPATKIKQPKLVCNGLELSLVHPGSQAIKAGDRPQFELTAVNTARETRTAKVLVEMTCTAPTSPLSRTIAMPTELWQQEQTLTLKAGETRTLPLASTAAVPTNNLISVHLYDLDPSVATITSVPTGAKPVGFFRPSLRDIVALTFSTVTNTAKPLQLVSRAK